MPSQIPVTLEPLPNLPTTKSICFHCETETVNQFRGKYLDSLDLNWCWSCHVHYVFLKGGIYHVSDNEFLCKHLNKTSG